MSTKDLAAKVRELKELQAMQEEITAEIEAIQDTIKAEMAARATEELTVDVFKIRWTVVNGTRLDSKALKADHADLYAMYSKPTQSRRFTVQ